MSRRGEPLPEGADDATPPLAWRLTGWIMQAAVLVLLSGGVLLGVTMEREPSGAGGVLGHVVFLAFAFLAAWAWATVVAMRARRPIARWIGGTLIGMFVLVGLQCLGAAANAIAAGTTRIATLGAWFAYELLMLVWLYAFACADDVDRYLGRD